MANAGEDLDLLLSLGEEKVLETPPASPSSSPRPNLSAAADMSVFRDAVKDYLDPNLGSAPASTAAKNSIPTKPNKSNRSGESEIDKYSGLRIKNQLVSALELNRRFSEVKFVRLPVIKNLLMGDTLSGCWATVGVLTEKGNLRSTSAGKDYSVWKMACLDQSNVSVFLFNDAYMKNCQEPVGSVFAIFNSTVRKDSGHGFSLSVYSASNIMKIGTSADYGVCKGKKKDGVSCTMVINKCLGKYCKYHSSTATQRYTTTRAELKGGNFRNSSIPFRLQPEGIYMVDPLSNSSKQRKNVQQVKVMSVDGLKRALSRAETVTTNGYSQGLRFLSQVTAGNSQPKVASKASTKPSQLQSSLGKRPSLATGRDSHIGMESKSQDKKKMKYKQLHEKTIELDIISSDEEVL